MKTFFKYLSVFVLAAAAYGCADDRDYLMVDDSFCLTAKDGLVTASVHTGEFTVGVSKSGKGKTAAVATLSCAEDDVLSALMLYNIKNNTSYEMIPSDKYTVQSQVKFAASDAVKEAVISWDAGTLSNYIGGSENKVIPIRLSSSDLSVNGEKNFVMVRVLRSHIKVGQTRIPRSFASDFFNPENGKKPDLKESLTLDISNNSSIRGVEIEFPFIFDNSLIAAYNASIDDPELTFTQAPEGLVSFQTGEAVGKAVMEAGKSSTQLKLTLNRGMLQEDGVLKDFPNYVIPVRMDTGNIKARRGDREFEVDGMTFGNIVTYITIRKASDGIADVGIEWGKYSASSAWYSYLEGFPSNGDRNLAMDDRYVYVASSSASPAIYALNISDGSLAKKLDLGEAKSLEYGAFCVRMIPNGSGEDILSFCSLKLSENTKHLYVFAYKNGVDKAPVKILDYLRDNKGGADDWRRYGDKYTVQGTWQSGALWFHTFNAVSANVGKTIVFPITNGEIGSPQDPTDYIFDSGTGDMAREITLYPGLDQVLLTSPEGAAMYAKTTDDSVNGWLKWAPTAVDMGAFKLTYGYNFFKFHGKDYIAFAKLDGGDGQSKKARLMIMEDNAAKPADFPTQLVASTGLLQFPLQDPADFDAESKLAAEYNVADCAVRNVNGTTYVAAMANGIGLTLFSLQ